MRRILLFALLTFLSMQAWGASVEWKNRFGISGEWHLADDYPVARAFWVPEFSFKAPIAKEIAMQAEYSADVLITAHRPDEDIHLEFDLDHYRAWLALNRKNTELRVGLQRLSFGSAQILRPLQWFDGVDRLDQYQSTKGVQALLGRHYFPNNANIWLWGILSDGERKGMDMFPSRKYSYEAGGRAQYPIPRGEAAITFHYREADPGVPNANPKETRAGFDVRIDTIVGLWTEAAYSRLEAYDAESGIQTFSATLGTDYTFGIGNGVYLLAEGNLSYLQEGDLFSTDDPLLSSAVMLSYPLGLLDTLILLNVFDHDNGASMHSLLFRRSYDYLSLELGVTTDFKQRFGGNDNRSVRLAIYYNI